MFSSSNPIAGSPHRLTATISRHLRNQPAGTFLGQGKAHSARDRFGKPQSNQCFDAPQPFPAWSSTPTLSTTLHIRDHIARSRHRSTQHLLLVEIERSPIRDSRSHLIYLITARNTGSRRRRSARSPRVCVRGEVSGAGDAEGGGDDSRSARVRSALRTHREEVSLKAPLDLVFGNRFGSGEQVTVLQSVPTAVASFPGANGTVCPLPSSTFASS